jgi:sulfite exporter TauE/SafE
VNELQYGAALTLGFLGGSHCLVMCGGIGSALGMGVAPSHRYLMLALFQLGRVGSYTLLGAALGAGLGAVSGGSPGLPILRVLSGLLLVSMACYLGNWWQGLLFLERLGQHLWRHVQPLTQALLPVKHWHHALLVGLCWGFLPCGLIYTALAWSATAGSASQSALLMFFFGAGTMPVMFATGVAGNNLTRLLRHAGFRQLAALLLLCFGLWVIASVALGPHGGHRGSQDLNPAADHSQHSG